MKVHYCFLLLVVFGLLTTSSCKDTEEDTCENPIQVTDLQPNQNPPGYEILIEGGDFTEDAVVRFGNEVAVSRLDEDLGLVATVPDNLLGVVEVSVAEGPCIARMDFEVWSEFLDNVPVSPTQIFVPTVPSYNFASGFQNSWSNFSDEDHFLFLEDEDSDGAGELGPFSEEQHFGDKPFLNGNPITGSIDPINNEIELTIDRTTNGGEKETYDGQYIDLFPELPANTTKVILLTSRTDGRQLVIYFPG